MRYINVIRLKLYGEILTKYNSPMCIINSTRIEQETCSTYKKYSKKVHDVFQLRDYLLERDVFSCLHSQAQPKAIHGMDAGSTLLISRERDMDEEYDLNCDAQAMIKMPDLDTNIEKLTKCAYLRISQKTSG